VQELTAKLVYMVGPSPRGARRRGCSVKTLGAYLYPSTREAAKGRLRVAMTGRPAHGPTGSWERAPSVPPEPAKKNEKIDGIFLILCPDLSLRE
jgi:hypothetical protein